MTRITRVAAIALLALGAAASPVHAQGAPVPSLPDPEQIGRFHLGPIRFTPSVQIRELGVDSNVFNETADPKQDTTVRVGPEVEFWGRLGPRALLYGSTSIDYQYFRRYESQRSFGTTNIARIDLDVGRLRPFAEGAFTSTRVRPGFEIDERARREESFGRAGLGILLFSRTQLVAWGRTARHRYNASEEFLGQSLADALDRDAETLGTGLEVELTPLTTFVVSGELQQDRFVRSPERNADSVKVTPGFRFKPFALIDGTVYVGYRRFETLSPLVPDYSGVAAAVNLGYTLRATRFVGRFNRDVTYSYETIEPYYLQTDWSLDVTQKITRRWDVVGRGGTYTLDYQRISAAGAEGRKDRGKLFGGGLGYLLGEHVRFGVDVDYLDRRSDTDITRTYDNVRAGASITYGLKQP